MKKKIERIGKPIPKRIMPLPLDRTYSVWVIKNPTYGVWNYDDSSDYFGINPTRRIITVLNEHALSRDVPTECPGCRAEKYCETLSSDYTCAAILKKFDEKEIGK